MRTLLATVLGAALLALALPAAGTCPDPPIESRLQPGEVGLFFDPEGRDRCEEIPLFTPFTFHVVVGVPLEGLQGMLLPDGFVGTGELTFLGVNPGAIGFDVIQIADACLILRVADGQPCPVGPGTTLAVASFTAMRMTASSAWCPSDFTCSTFAGPRPQILTSLPCDAVWDELDLYLHGAPLSVALPFCLRFEGGVPARTHRWGPLKHIFRADP